MIAMGSLFYLPYASAASVVSPFPRLFIRQATSLRWSSGMMRFLSTVLCVLSLIALPSWAAPAFPSNATFVKRTANSGKGVYAHFMVGNAYSYTQDTWKTNIQLAQANGIDGFALNTGRDDWQPARVADAYAAAQALGTGFKLFMSLDMTSLYCSAASDANIIRQYVNNHINHPNQLYYEDQHILSTFSGSDCTFGQGNFNAGWNYAIRNGANDRIGFIPSFFVDPGSFGGITVMNGDFNWNGGWPQGDYDVSFSTDQTHITDVGDRYYIAPISPLFYTHYGVNSYNKNWIYRSDDWQYNTRWEQLIANRDKIDFVEIVSWNDYGESHYIGPIGADQPNSQAWVNGFDHQGYLKMTKYYADAWRTGTYPAITKNQIFLSARPHSRDANTGDPVGKPSNWQWTDDYLYAVVFSTGTGTLKLSIGSSSSSTAIKAGVNKVKLALSPGSPRATLLSSSGSTLVDFAPSGFTYTANPVAYNFNYYVAASP